MAEYGLHIAYEPLAWVSVRSLEQALEVIGEAGCSNVGLAVDTFIFSLARVSWTRSASWI